MDISWQGWIQKSNTNIYREKGKMKKKNLSKFIEIRRSINGRNKYTKERLDP